mmetsp:Transcript_23931/g.71506  ORF Transcript_23931/g.71506 Transcript_23931/m.71506 type:complete len:408 (+) Transcript_23931:445-1668(+)
MPVRLLRHGGQERRVARGQSPPHGHRRRPAAHRAVGPALEGAKRHGGGARTTVILFTLLLRVLNGQRRGCRFRLSRAGLAAGSWLRRQVVPHARFELQLTALQQVSLGLLPKEPAEPLPHARGQLLTVPATPHRQVIILGVLYVVRVAQGHGTLLDPVDPEVCAKPARKIAPDARQQHLVRLACHLPIALEVPVLRGGEYEDDVVHIPESLPEPLAVAHAAGPDPLGSRDLDVPHVHGADEKVPALPMDRRRQPRDGPLLRGRRQRRESELGAGQAIARTLPPDLCEVHLISPWDQVRVQQKRVQEPVWQQFRQRVPGQPVMPAAAHGPVPAETQAVALALGPFARRYMPEDALRVVALPKLQPEDALRHAVRVVLVQKIAFLALHAQVPQPVLADDAVASTRRRTL